MGWKNLHWNIKYSFIALVIILIINTLGAFFLPNLGGSKFVYSDFFMMVILFISMYLSINLWGWKKGIFLGGLIGLIYVFVVDLIIIKSVISTCSGYCGIENFILSVILGIIAVIGLFIWIISWMVHPKINMDDMVDNGKKLAERSVRIGLIFTFLTYFVLVLIGSIIFPYNLSFILKIGISFLSLFISGTITFLISVKSQERRKIILGIYLFFAGWTIYTIISGGTHIVYNAPLFEALFSLIVGFIIYEIYKRLIMKKYSNNK